MPIGRANSAAQAFRRAGDCRAGRLTRRRPLITTTADAAGDAAGSRQRTPPGQRYVTHTSASAGRNCPPGVDERSLTTRCPAARNQAPTRLLGLPTRRSSASGRSGLYPRDV